MTKKEVNSVTVYENINYWILSCWVLIPLWDKWLKCLSEKMTEMSQQKKPRHKVKVASKFHQTCRLLTVDVVVLEHIFVS